jgi:hypothetical protein
VKEQLVAVGRGTFVIEVDFAGAIIETGAHHVRKRILHGHETAGSKLTSDCIDIHDPATIPCPHPMRRSTWIERTRQCLGRRAIVVEACEVRLRLFLRRRTVALAGLSCFVLLLPRLARAQAEELPPELAGEQNVPSPTRPSQASSQTMDAPQPASQAVPTPIHRPTILFVSYLGFTLPVGDGWAGFNTSPRVGALLGWHATDRLSLNGEFDVDYVRSAPDPPNPRRNFWDGFWNPPRHYIDLTFSPLVSLRAGQIRLGPKIGWFTSNGSVAGMPASGSGLLVGFNAGLFLPYRGVSVGGLLTGSLRVFTSTNQPYGAHHTMGLLAAVLL